MKRTKKDKQKWKQKHQQPITNVKNEICLDLNPVKGDIGTHTDGESERDGQMESEPYACYANCICLGNWTNTKIFSNMQAGTVTKRTRRETKRKMYKTVIRFRTLTLTGFFMGAGREYWW